jgi:hypothetical protein
MGGVFPPQGHSGTVELEENKCGCRKAAEQRENDMHVGKFHAAIDLIDTEFREKRILEVFNTVISQLSTSASNPSNPDQTKAFREHYQQLRELLDSSGLNHVHLLRRTIFEEVGAMRYVGRGLLEVIDRVISTNNLAPALAVQELQKVHADTTTFHQTITSLNGGFSALQLEYDELEPNEGEFGISIPRTQTAEDFASFVKELKSYSTAFNAFNEVVSDNNQPLTVKTISSSDWQIYLLAAPVVLKVISHTLKDIAEILRSLVDIKKNVKELLSKGVPEAAIANINDFGDTMIDERLRGLAEKIVVEHYKKEDDGRRNELTNHLSQSLKFIAHKIDIGVKLDIRICPPTEPEADPETPEGAEAFRRYEELKQFADEVNQCALLGAEISEQKGEVLQLAAPNMDADEKKKTT